MLGTALAVLAMVPGKFGLNLPVTMLALAVATSCAYLSPLLRATGTDRDLVVAKAQARLDVVLTRQYELKTHIYRTASWAAPYLTRKPRVTAQGFAYLTLIIGGLPTVILLDSLLRMLGSVTTRTGSVAISFALLALLLPLAAAPTMHALMVLQGLSLWRLLAQKERLRSATPQFVIPMIVLGFFTLLAVASDEETAQWFRAVVLACVVADVLACLINCTIVATIIDHRRLESFATVARSQIDYLTPPESTASSPAHIPPRNPNNRHHKPLAAAVLAATAASVIVGRWSRRSAS